MTNRPAHDKPDRSTRSEDRPGTLVHLPRRPVAPPAAAVPGTGHSDGSFTVNCAECAHRHTDTCDDCVVTFIVGRAPDDALVVDADEARAVRLLQRAGLVPAVRHEVEASGQ